MLELRGIRAGYRGTEVLREVDLAVEEGELVGIVGPNGAGKTTLLRAICGLLPTLSGEVSFRGRRLNGLLPERIARLGLALVPEGRHVFTTLTVAENLRLAAAGSSESDSIERALQRFPFLRERRGERADRLSGGERQQLAIARALLTEPRLLILDEPSLGLAPRTIDLIYKQLAALADGGMTMLLVEQNAARTIDFCDRCLVLSGGRIQAQGSRASLQDDRQLRSYLGGEL